jgi:hypothetical protein
MKSYQIALLYWLYNFLVFGVLYTIVIIIQQSDYWELIPAGIISLPGALIVALMGWLCGLIINALDLHPPQPRKAKLYIRGQRIFMGIILFFVLLCTWGWGGFENKQKGVAPDEPGMAPMVTQGSTGVNKSVGPENPLYAPLYDKGLQAFKQGVSFPGSVHLYTCFADLKHTTDQGKTDSIYTIYFEYYYHNDHDMVYSKVDVIDDSARIVQMGADPTQDTLLMRHNEDINKAFQDLPPDVKKTVDSIIHPN